MYRKCVNFTGKKCKFCQNENCRFHRVKCNSDKLLTMPNVYSVMFVPIIVSFLYFQDLIRFSNVAYNNLVFFF